MFRINQIFNTDYFFFTVFLISAHITSGKAEILFSWNFDISIKNQFLIPFLLLFLTEMKKKKV